MYLDHAATTVVRAEALAAFTTASHVTGNAASMHAAGRHARRLLEDARESIAASLGCRADEVVLTSGGTEADTLAVQGVFRARHRADPRRRRILLSAVEHPAVRNAAETLVVEGAEVVVLPVDSGGRVDVGATAQRILADGGPATIALLGCMWANNEVGTIQPIAELGGLAAQYRVPMHVDAVQAATTIPVSAHQAGVTTMAISGHKVGAPIGVGVLTVRAGTDLVAPTPGGGQESGRRGGTVSVALALALAGALRTTVATRADEGARLGRLRADLIDGLLRGCPGAHLSGAGDPRHNLPSIAHLTFPGCDSEDLLLLLDRLAIAASTGSACRSGVHDPSPVLQAMRQPEDHARGAVRFSLGHTTTRADIDAVVRAMPGVVVQARAARRAHASAELVGTR